MWIGPFGVEAVDYVVKMHVVAGKCDGEGGLGVREELRTVMALGLKLLRGSSLIHGANAIGLNEISDKR